MKVSMSAARKYLTNSDHMSALTIAEERGLFVRWFAASPVPDVRFAPNAQHWVARVLKVPPCYPECFPRVSVRAHRPSRCGWVNLLVYTFSIGVVLILGVPVPGGNSPPSVKKKSERYRIKVLYQARPAVAPSHLVDPMRLPLSPPYLNVLDE